MSDDDEDVAILTDPKMSVDVAIGLDEFGREVMQVRTKRVRKRIDARMRSQLWSLLLVVGLISLFWYAAFIWLPKFWR